MKLCTFVRPHEGGAEPSESRGPRLGALLPHHPEVLVDLAPAAQALGERAQTEAAAPGRAAACLSSMQALLDAGPPAFELVRRLLEVIADEATFCLPVADVALLAPLPRPRSLRDGMSFERHFLQARRGGAKIKFPPLGRLDEHLRRLTGLSLIGVPRLYRQFPCYYKGNPASVIGPEAAVRWPSYTERLDYELEIGVYIHRTGRDLSPQEALDHIGGYSLFNDFSARDIQIREMDLGLGPAKGKDFDTGNALGPYLVTPDEVGDPTSLRVQARVNGEVWTASSTADMRFSVGELLSYIARDETLYPGDFIGLGTVPNGCGLEHGNWLRPGDVIEIEASGLGTLRNRIAPPADRTGGRLDYRGIRP